MSYHQMLQVEAKHDELLREAEQERLAKEARSANQRPSLLSRLRLNVTQNEGVVPCNVKPATVHLNVKQSEI